MLNHADGAFVDSLAGALPDGTLRAPDAHHLEEPRGRWAGRAGAVACPASVEEVSLILRAAAAARVGVIPFGGGTGLVGGQVAADGSAPLILSLERMDRIRAIEPAGNVLVAEAGCILAEVQSAAAEIERLFPLSLASEGSARIGGLLATNAGGTGVLRWGNARDLCLGLEVVMADGQIWHGLRRLRKDNMGYDLRHLILGSEGTLGVITAASLRMVPRPARQGAAMIVVRDPAAALELLSRAQARLGEAVSAFELIGGMGLRFLAEKMPHVRQPFDEPPDWLVLIELGLAADQDPEAALTALFEEAAAAGLALDGVIAASDAQRAQFWKVRESLPEANRKIGSVSSHDVSVPMGAVPEFLARAEPELARIGTFRVNCFGHLGDGNLHWNVFPAPGRCRADHEDQRLAIKTCIHDLVHSLGGSIAAEHGIGRLKVADLEHYGDPVALSAMRAIKAALDPLGILNPGAVLRTGG